ncbi:MAG: hypothetical protein JXQ73_24920 [Phycisphaerae bacterium]|nr:hypothetical protein [Phycisphaerae bacterium]
MADEPVQAASKEAADGGQGGGGKRNMVLGGILAGVMLLEGVGLYVGMKMFGAGPEQATAEEGLVDKAQKKISERPEVPIAKLKVPNRKTGKNYLYDIEVAATIIVPEGKTTDEFKAEITEQLKARENSIEDRLSFLIRSANPQELDEPGLVTMRRQIKAELGKIFNDEKLFDEVLLPRWTPLRADM